MFGKQFFHFFTVPLYQERQLEILIVLCPDFEDICDTWFSRECTGSCVLI